VRGRDGGQEGRAGGRTRGVNPGPSSSLASRRLPGKREGRSRDHASRSAAAAAAASAEEEEEEEEEEEGGREGGKRSSSLPSSRTSTCPLGPTLSGAEAMGASTVKTFPPSLPPSLPPSFADGSVIFKAIN